MLDTMAGPDLQALLSADAPTVLRERAFAELLRLVTIFVRARMGGKLREQRDSMDVCQSIAKSFVDDASSGRLVFENQAALNGYLQQVVRTKLAELARHDGAHKRGGGTRARDSGSSPEELPGTDPTASMQAIGKERAQSIEDQLTAEDIEIARMRARGMEWGVIASSVGKSEASLRQRWSRVQRKIQSEGSAET